MEGPRRYPARQSLLSLKVHGKQSNFARRKRKEKVSSDSQGREEVVFGKTHHILGQVPGYVQRTHALEPGWNHYMASDMDKLSLKILLIKNFLTLQDWAKAT